MKEIHFLIPSPPNCHNERMHWSMRARIGRLVRKQVWEALVEQGALPTANDRLVLAKTPTKRSVRFLRFFGRKAREMDFDGLTGACKPILDALKLVVSRKKRGGLTEDVQGCGLIFDDKPAWVALQYDQERRPEHSGYIEVTISF
jgi:hypothetical protein